MWVTTPKTIQQILIEQPLEPVSEEALDQFARDWQHRGLKQSLPGSLRDMPVVQIGQPETWTLQEFYAPSELPLPIETKLAEADFYLVRLSCSFRPIHNESRVEWARFRAALLPHASAAGQPVAFDLYPQQVVQEVKRTVKVTLNPTLKFQEVQASLGSAEVGFEYGELIPRVSSAIGASFDPSWDYSAGLGQEVQGTKWMYLFVKAPKGMTTGRAQLELEADVQVRGVPLPVTVWRKQEKEAKPLTVTLWG